MAEKIQYVDYTFKSWFPSKKMIKEILVHLGLVLDV